MRDGDTGGAVPVRGGKRRRTGGGGRLNVLIHRNTASNQCTALRLAKQLRGVRQQYIHVPTEGQREGGRASILAACNPDTEAAAAAAGCGVQGVEKREMGGGEREKKTQEEKIWIRMPLLPPLPL